MHLFEGGILDKMTTAEYEQQSRMMSKDQAQQSIELAAVENANANANANNDKTSEAAKTQQQPQDNEMISALNLRMLQGAFIALAVGSLTAGEFPPLTSGDYNCLSFMLHFAFQLLCSCWNFSVAACSSLSRCDAAVCVGCAAGDACSASCVI